MPSYAYNTLTITCKNKAERNAVQAFVLGDEDVFDFDRIIPMPKCLDIVARGDSEAALAAFCLTNSLPLPKAAPCLSQRSLQDGDEFLAAHCAEASKKDLAYGKMIYDNLKQTGYMTWYEWRIDKWGTKWSAYATSVEVSGDTELLFHFDTAWCAPEPVIEELSRRFPEAEFVLDTDYEGGDPATLLVYRNGQCVKRQTLEMLIVGSDGKIYNTWDDLPDGVDGDLVREDEAEDAVKGYKRDAV